MKLFNALVGIILCFFASSVSSTTINGRFTVLNITSTEFTVLLQINTNTGTDDLGGTTIVFSFDTTAISFTSSPVKDIDYVFNNFSSGNYSSATVTRPMNNKIWVNIDLPYNHSNNGTVVTASPEWTDVVTIYFDIVDPNTTPDLTWLTTSPFWGIYDADNSTLWETGVFEDFPTSVAPVPDIPTNYELSQNYPNPFNPSTRIRYSIPSVIASGTRQSQLITLKVYDILGNEVATLVNEKKESGNYEVEFRPGSSILNPASGIYFYRLTAGDPSAGSQNGQAGQSFVETKKMILMK